MNALPHVITSATRAGRWVPGMARAFVPIAKNAINAARTRLRPAWEYASRNESREALRMEKIRQELRPSFLTRAEKFLDKNFAKLYGGVVGLSTVAATIDNKKKSTYTPPTTGATIKRKTRPNETQDSGFEGFPVTSYLSELPSERRARPPGSGIYVPENSGTSHSGGGVRSLIYKKKRTQYD